MKINTYIFLLILIGVRLVYSFIAIIIIADTVHKETRDFITGMVKDYSLSDHLLSRVLIKSLHEFTTILFHLMLKSILFIFLQVPSSYMIEVRSRLNYVIPPSKIFSPKYI
jgi:hypothetical protein